MEGDEWGVGVVSEEGRVVCEEGRVVCEEGGWLVRGEVMDEWRGEGDEWGVVVVSEEWDNDRVGGREMSE